MMLADPHDQESNSNIYFRFASPACDCGEHSAVCKRRAPAFSLVLPMRVGPALGLRQMPRRSVCKLKRLCERRPGKRGKSKSQSRRERLGQRSLREPRAKPSGVRIVLLTGPFAPGAPAAWRHVALRMRIGLAVSRLKPAVQRFIGIIASCGIGQRNRLSR